MDGVSAQAQFLGPQKLRILCKIPANILSSDFETLVLSLKIIKSTCNFSFIQHILLVPELKVVHNILCTL